MKLFNVLTTFPEMFDALKHSIIKKSMEKKLIALHVVNIRDYSENKHKNTDDYIYGGGTGMIMTPQPVISSLNALKNKGYIIYMTPKGNPLTQDKVIQLSKKDCLTIICGHYEGVDQRIVDYYVDEQVSIGDYVVTGGEIPAMILIDSITRMEDGVLKKEAYQDESHFNGLLEHRQYTRPEKFEGHTVPDVLLSGNHKLIEEYKKNDSLIETYKYRRDLLEKRGISREESTVLINEFNNQIDDIMQLIRE